MKNEFLTSGKNAAFQGRRECLEFWKGADSAPPRGSAGGRGGSRCPAPDPITNFRRLVLGCIDSYDSEKRRIFQDFSRSTRFLCLRTAKTSKFQIKIVKLFWRNEMKFHFIPILVDEFWSFFREILMKIFQNFMDILRK